MGDRVSIQFVNPEEPEWGRKSVVLFSHWGGREFAEQAQAYADALTDEVHPNAGMGPLDRMEPNTVMVDYIRHITKELPRVDGNLYLGATDRDGDNGDNGHFEIVLGRPAAERRQLERVGRR